MLIPLQLSDTKRDRKIWSQSSTYGSELVSARLTTEMVMEARYKLSVTVVPFHGLSLMLGGNVTVIFKAL